jgi:hypothetical protein
MVCEPIEARRAGTNQRTDLCRAFGARFMVPTHPGLTAGPIYWRPFGPPGCGIHTHSGHQARFNFGIQDKSSHECHEWNTPFLGKRFCLPHMRGLRPASWLQSQVKAPLRSQASFAALGRFRLQLEHDAAARSVVRMCGRQNLRLPFGCGRRPRRDIRGCVCFLPGINWRSGSGSSIADHMA